jgi:hypothetical protein
MCIFQQGRTRRLLLNVIFEKPCNMNEKLKYSGRLIGKMSFKSIFDILEYIRYTHEIHSVTKKICK